MIASDRMSGLVSGKTIQRKQLWLVTDGTWSCWSMEWGWAGHGCLPRALVGTCTLTTCLQLSEVWFVAGWVSEYVLLSTCFCVVVLSGGTSVVWTVWFQHIPMVGTSYSHDEKEIKGPDHWAAPLLHKGWMGRPLSNTPSQKGLNGGLNFTQSFQPVHYLHYHFLSFTLEMNQCQSF